MKFRPRYSLRTIFVLIALVSIPLAWRQSNIHWMADRKNALEWIAEHFNIPGGKHGLVATYVRLDINGAGDHLPWSIRYWGQGQLALSLLGIISDEMTPETNKKIEEIRALFPECS